MVSIEDSPVRTSFEAVILARSEGPLQLLRRDLFKDFQLHGVEFVCEEVLAGESHSTRTRQGCRIEVNPVSLFLSFRDVYTSTSSDEING